VAKKSVKDAESQQYWSLFSLQFNQLCALIKMGFDGFWQY
jgi:hypothetical protein